MVEQESNSEDRNKIGGKEQDFSAHSFDESKKPKENQEDKKSRELTQEIQSKIGNGGKFEDQEEKNKDRKDFKFSSKSKENYKQLIEIIFLPKITEKNLQETLEISNQLFIRKKINEKQFENLKILLEKKLSLKKIDKEIEETKKNYTKRFNGFMPSTEWQEAPEGTPIPPGGEVRFDISPDGKKKSIVKWNDPYEGMPGEEKERINKLFEEKQKIEKELEIKRISEKKGNQKEKILRDANKKVDKGKDVKIKGSSLSSKEEKKGENAQVSTENNISSKGGKFSRDEELLNKILQHEMKGEDAPQELKEAAAKRFIEMVCEIKSNVKTGKVESSPISPELAEEIERRRPGFSSKEDRKNFKDWFLKKLYAINEEYINERSDTNFTLLWELRQALNVLWSEEKDSNVKEINELRKELTKHFEAHMGLHNFIYLYRRVSGVGDIVTATNLLNMRDIEFLLGKPEIIKYLKKFEVKGKEYKNLVEEKFKLDWIDGLNNKGRCEEIENEKKKILKFLRNLQNGEEEKEVEEGGKKKIVKVKLGDAWAAIMSGGLFSFLHGSARYKMVLSTGDFFFGRLYDIKNHVKERWEAKWNRKPFKNLYEALDLGLDNFWEEYIEDNLDNLDKIKEKLDALQDTKLTTEAVAALDADDIRRMILKPGELADSLNDAKLKSMLDKFNHKKGKERSEWFKNVFRQIAIYHRNRNLPWIDSLPNFLRKSDARKDLRYSRPWSKEDIKWKILAFGQILTDEDKEKLLGEFVGSRTQRGFSTFVKISVPVTLNAIWGAVRGFFGALFKYIFGEIK
jgi:hypothetical protein